MIVAHVLLHPQVRRTSKAKNHDSCILHIFLSCVVRISLCHHGKIIRAHQAQSSSYRSSSGGDRPRPSLFIFRKLLHCLTRHQTCVLPITTSGQQKAGLVSERTEERSRTTACSHWTVKCHKGVRLETTCTCLECLGSLLLNGARKKVTGRVQG